VERARFFAKKMDSALAIVDKRRTDINVAEVMHVIGDVRRANLPGARRLDRHGGTLVKTAHCFAGERGVVGIFVRIACSAVGASGREHCEFRPGGSGVTNTIPLTEAAAKEPKIKVRSIAGLIGSAIRSIHERRRSAIFLRRLG